MCLAEWLRLLYLYVVHQAKKEWRVVTEHLNTLIEHSQHGEASQNANLIEIDVCE